MLVTYRNRLSVTECSVIKWLVKLYVRFLLFLHFFSKSKQHDFFCIFEFLYTFSRTLVRADLKILGLSQIPTEATERWASEDCIECVNFQLKLVYQIIQYLMKLRRMKLRRTKSVPVFLVTLYAVCESERLSPSCIRNLGGRELNPPSPKHKCNTSLRNQDTRTH